MTDPWQLGGLQLPTQVVTAQNPNPQGNYAVNESGIDLPGFTSFQNPDGTVNKNYAYDPSQSAAFQQLNNIATSTDLSPWAQLQMQSNAASTLNQRDQANAQSLGATNQALQQQMATGGGTNSGASAFLAMQGARNATMANQNIGNQANLNNLNIQSTDAQNKQQLLGQVANTQTQALAANAQTAQNSTTAQNAFNANVYNQQMQAWAAAKTGDAQTTAANNSGKK